MRVAMGPWETKEKNQINVFSAFYKNKALRPAPVPHAAQVCVSHVPLWALWIIKFLLCSVSKLVRLSSIVTEEWQQLNFPLLC